MGLFCTAATNLFDAPGGCFRLESEVTAQEGDMSMVFDYVLTGLVFAFLGAMAIGLF
jgi:hypothetical protein